MANKLFNRIDSRLQNEELDDSLKKLYLEFDKFCAENGIEYSIDVDEHNKQAYRIIDQTNIEDLKKHVHELAAHLPITVDIDQDRNSNDGILFTFGIKAIIDDQYKSPTRKHTLDQSAFPSSFTKSKTFGGRGAEESRVIQRIDKRLDEELIGISLPDILATITGAMTATVEPEVEVGTQVVKYTIEATPEDMNLIDELFRMIEDGQISQVIPNFCPSGIIRITRTESTSESTQ